MIEYRLLHETELSDWDGFVARQPCASVYHESVWRHILAEVFGKRWYLLVAIRGARICAGLPLVHMKSFLFGNFLVSMPYVNYGGILTEDVTLIAPLLRWGAEFGKQLGARYLELRHLENYYPYLPVRTDKVSMWLTLPATAQELFASFKSKLRSQIRKGKKNGLRVQTGRAELLEKFHMVYTHNMRALGTPAYPRSFYQKMLEAFPSSARVIIVTGAEERPLAGGFLLGYRDRLEIPSASSIREYNHLQTNMWLYWNCLKYACEQGYHTFDFGRSTEGSSTFNFKAQWGARPVPHYWHYHLATGREVPHLNPQNSRFRIATRLWQQLPLSLTRRMGPAIVKHLP
jgi:serine/alanine adding enzyme